jgi:hypothetical protein
MKEISFMKIRSFSLLALAAACLPVAGGADSILISSYFDDPFVGPSVIKRMDPAEFGQADNGRPMLRSNRVWITDEDFIFKADKDTGIFTKFAWNPWPQSWANPRWDLTFPDEDRFPLFKPLRGVDNQIVLKDGLQVWIPQDLNLGNTTTFETANSVKDAADLWSGRFVNWGVQGGFLLIETHAFIDFNAFFSVSMKQLFFGVVPYRLPGHSDVHLFETATSTDMVGHEAGHAVLDVLKPKASYISLGFRTWGESFADQTALWTSLRGPERVAQLLAETHGDFNQSNSLSRIGEAYAALTGKGAALRDAFNDKKVSDTTEEVHDRSEVLTGAAYRLFLTVFDEQRRSLRDEDALSEAGRIIGMFLLHSTDYTPENDMTLDDVAKAYLKVDKEFFAGRYHDVLINEFTRRELINEDSVRNWLSHEEALPRLWLPGWSTDTDVAAFVEQNQTLLAPGPDFGLKLQSVTRLSGAALGRIVVRVQLTQGQGADATPLNNHGIMVFRANGDLADYHSPIPGEEGRVSGPNQYLGAQAAAAIGKARQARLHLYGVPLSLVRRADGSLSAEVHVLRGEGLNAYMVVFTPENPRGERREILESPLSPEQRLAIADVVAQ